MVRLVRSAWQLCSGLILYSDYFDAGLARSTRQPRPVPNLGAWPMRGGTATPLFVSSCLAGES